MEGAVRAPIEEIEPFEAEQEIEGGDVVLIDTREPHEHQESHLEGDKLVPPGLLKAEIEAAAPDKSARTILYCPGGLDGGQEEGKKGTEGLPQQSNKKERRRQGAQGCETPTQGGQEVA
jgi:hypothetical protein